MRVNDAAISMGLSSADIAWPIVLALCIALMIAPFVFVILGRGEADGDDKTP